VTAHCRQMARPLAEVAEAPRPRMAHQTPLADSPMSPAPLPLPAAVSPQNSLLEACLVSCVVASHGASVTRSNTQNLTIPRMAQTWVNVGHRARARFFKSLASKCRARIFLGSPATHRPLRTSQNVRRPKFSSAGHNISSPRLASSLSPMPFEAQRSCMYSKKN
jgi:hypothetical protein